MMTTPLDIQAAYERFKSFADKSEDAFFNHTDDYELICGLFEKEIQSPAPEQCPLGDDYDLTIAYMKGCADGKDDCDRVIRTLAGALEMAHQDYISALLVKKKLHGRQNNKEICAELDKKADFIKDALSDPAVVKVMGVKKEGMGND